MRSLQELGIFIQETVDPKIDTDGEPIYTEFPRDKAGYQLGVIGKIGRAMLFPFDAAAFAFGSQYFELTREEKAEQAQEFARLHPHAIRFWIYGLLIKSLVVNARERADQELR